MKQLAGSKLQCRCFRREHRPDLRQCRSRHRLGGSEVVRVNRPQLGQETPEKGQKQTGQSVWMAGGLVSVASKRQLPDGLSGGLLLALLVDCAQQGGAHRFTLVVLFSLERNIAGAREGVKSANANTRHQADPLAGAPQCKPFCRRGRRARLCLGPIFGHSGGCP